MKKLGCADVGMKECGFVATGKTSAEVKEKLMTHAMKVHAAKMKAMSPKDADMANKMMDEMLSKQM